jgi:hypothetical protein
MKMFGSVSKRQINRLRSSTAWRSQPPIIAPSIYAHAASARLRLATFVLD